MSRPAETLPEIPLNLYEPHIASALAGYTALSHGEVRFDLEAAGRLSKTPEKPNYARSSSMVSWRGKDVGTLHVIAFAPGDGTGDLRTYQPGDFVTDTTVDPYKMRTAVVPRDKSGVTSELYMPLLAHNPRRKRPPVLWAGHLDEVGIRDGRVRKIHTLGEPEGEFLAAMVGEHKPEPRVSYTAGYRRRNSLLAVAPNGVSVRNLERFGDPHAVLNATRLVQVCGFFAISRSDDQGNFEAHRSLETLCPPDMPQTSL